MSVTFLTNEDMSSINDKIDSFVNTNADLMSIIHPFSPLDVTWATGGFNGETGGESSTSKRMRSEFFPIDSYIFDAPEGVMYTLYKYNISSSSTVAFVGKDGPFEGMQYIPIKDDANAYRILGRYADDRAITSADHGIIKISSIKSSVITAEYVVGTLLTTDGSNYTQSNRARTDFIPVEPLYIVPDSATKFNVYYYDADKVFIGRDLDSLSTFATFTNPPADAAYMRFTASLADDSKLNVSGGKNIARWCGWKVSLYTAKSPEYARAKLDRVASIVDSVAVTDNKYVSDVPENIGVLNAVRKAKQMLELRWTALDEVPRVTQNITAGSSVTVPYSQVINQVPSMTSMYTFMTAAKNPNSYLYTEDISKAPYGHAANLGKSYYGTHCAGLCWYALGIKGYFNTAQWANIPGMEPIENQSSYGLKLGDILWENGHVRIVTDITRDNRGRIGNIYSIEAVYPIASLYVKCVNQNRWTADSLDAEFKSGRFIAYRYRKIYASPYEQSPYVTVEDEVPITATFNTALIPRKGDKANWGIGEDIVIDVLEPGSYTSVEIQKDEAAYKSVSITNVVTLSNLPYGKYRARLTNGTATSDWCYWIVLDYSISVTKLGDAQAKISFSSANGTPVYTAWSEIMANHSYYATRNTEYVTDDEIFAGYRVSKYKTGNYRFYFAIETEYGIYPTPLTNSVSID